MDSTKTRSILKYFEAYQTCLNKLIKNRPEFKVGINGSRYRSIDQFIFENGKVMEPIHHKYPLMQQKQCFKNAAHFVQDHPRFVYCEGYALYAGDPVPNMHAWVCNSKGEAMELTWKNTTSKIEYFGIAIRRDYLWQCLEDMKYYGVIGCLELRYPLFRTDPILWRHKVMDRMKDLTFPPLPSAR